MEDGEGNVVSNDNNEGGRGRRLGRLEWVDDLRQAWPGEARAFTPWLARKENLDLLAAALHMELELEGTEDKIGEFSLDILCRDVSGEAEGEGWVVIENQIEDTNHRHLGQLMTYAAGRRAAAVVWVAKHFREEHIAALNWLNDITGDDIGFFGVEVRLARIDQSQLAPDFLVVARPNAWVKQRRRVAARPGTGELPGAQALRLAYWTQFSEMLREKSRFRIRNPKPQSWRYFSMGKGGFTLGCYFSVAKDKAEVFIKVGLSSVSLTRACFAHFEEDKESLESEMGSRLEWKDVPEGKKSAYITVSRTDLSLENKESWPALSQWMLETMLAFDRVFGPKIGSLDIPELQSDLEDDGDEEDDGGGE